MDVLIIKTIIALLIILILAFIIYRYSKDRREAKKFLDNFVNTLYKNMLSLISANTNLFKKNSLDRSKELILQMIHDSCWDYIESSSSSAMNSNKLPKAIFSVLTKEYVDEYVDKVIDMFNIETVIENRWNEAQIDEDFNKRLEEKDKALQEKYSNQDLYNEEIDETKDLELVDAGVAFVINEDGTTDEIERPADVEDPLLDTEQDESVEEIDENGLTLSEKEAGIRINKSGRKIDKLGRYVK